MASATWIETPKGFARIEYEPMTLAEKSRAFISRVQARHNRWGLTADSQLRVPGDLSTNQLVSSDNDGLWTAMYVAAECFRYKVTGDADARENARRGMHAIVRLESITGMPGFPGALVHQGRRRRAAQGRRVARHAGQAWRWKGDTSSDEIVGHYFVYPIYHDLVADEPEKPALRAVVERMTIHILDNNYQLVDSTETNTVGLVGARRDLGRSRRNRPARAAHPGPPARRAARDRERGPIARATRPPTTN